MRELNEWVEQGKVKPVIDTVFPLSEAASAMKKVSGRGVIGKVVMRP